MSNQVTMLSGKLRKKMVKLLQKHAVSRAAIFGSFASGTATDSSDLDVLVEFKGDKTLLDLVDLRLALQDLVGREVDVVTYHALHPRIRERVLQQQVPIL